MGRTRFAGPVYGSKTVLLSVGPVSPSTGSSAVLAGTVVPSYEEWWPTDLAVYRNSSGSTNLVISLHDDSTLVGSVTLTSSVAAGVSEAFTATAGEVEGVKVAAGSVLTVAHSSHAGKNDNLVIVLSGYRRFVGTE